MNVFGDGSFLGPIPFFILFKMTTGGNDMSEDNKNEIREISFRLRDRDRVKMIQSFLAMVVTSFEREASPHVLVMSESILANDYNKAQKAITTYLEELNLYKDSIEQVNDLIDEHIFLESTKTVSLSFKSGEKVSGADFAAMSAGAFEETEEKKKAIKKKIEKKKKAKETKKKTNK